jgi:hypothetical protein
MNKALTGIVLGAGVLAFSVSTASAATVCNGDVCWHAKEKYTYPRDSGVIVREDSWKPGPNIRFKEREGRGYWKGDTWVEF